MTDTQRESDQERYEALRANLLDRNEGSVNNIYLDPLGIPTVGIGVALTARQRDRSFRVDHDHVDALSDVLHLSGPQRQQLNGLLESQAVVQSRHRDESARNLPAFLAKPFGHESQEVLGPMVNTRHQTPGASFYSWDVLASPTSPMQIRLSHQQSIDLLQRVAPQYEDALKDTLNAAKCPPQALSEEQRAAIYSMVYQNSMNKASRTAHAIGEYWRGGITKDQLQSRLQHAVHDSKYVGDPTTSWSISTISGSDHHNSGRSPKNTLPSPRTRIARAMPIKKARKSPRTLLWRRSASMIGRFTTESASAPLKVSRTMRCSKLQRT